MPEVSRMQPRLWVRAPMLCVPYAALATSMCAHRIETYIIPKCPVRHMRVSWKSCLADLAVAQALGELLRTWLSLRGARLWRAPFVLRLRVSIQHVSLPSYVTHACIYQVISDIRVPACCNSSVPSTNPCQPRKIAATRHGSGARS